MIATAATDFDPATDIGYPAPTTLLDEDERALDLAWDRVHDVVINLDTRLERLGELIEATRYVLNREEVVDLDSALALYDNINALIAESIANGFMIDEYNEDVTFAMFDSLTKPAVAQDELILTASEYSRDLDDTFDAGYEDGLTNGRNLGYAEGIDAGILVASRVLRVLDARVMSVEDVRR